MGYDDKLQLIPLFLLEMLDSRCSIQALALRVSLSIVLATYMPPWAHYSLLCELSRCIIYTTNADYGRKRWSKIAVAPSNISPRSRKYSIHLANTVTRRINETS